MIPKQEMERKFNVVYWIYENLTHGMMKDSCFPQETKQRYLILLFQFWLARVSQ